MLPTIPPGPPALPGAAAPEPNSPGARICEVVVGATLCALRVWSESEWASLPEADRPRTHARCPGLGWVGAVPIAGLN